MAIPTTPCPVKGLVPWANGIWPIAWRGPHPALGWVYTIHEKLVDRGLQIHWNVSQADIVKAMENFALYRPHQLVQLGPLLRCRIIGRRWNFDQGTFYYLVEGGRAGQRWSIAQDDLIERINGVDQEVA